jgi:hypothetical protein
VVLILAVENFPSTIATPSHFPRGGDLIFLCGKRKKRLIIDQKFLTGGWWTEIFSFFFSSFENESKICKLLVYVGECAIVLISKR